MQRDIEVRLGVYTSLAQAFEAARIDEVRNIPVITIIDSPDGSAESNRRLATRTALALFLGPLVALLTLVISASMKKAGAVRNPSNSDGHTTWA